jgi:hypothetical protein
LKHRSVDDDLAVKDNKAPLIFSLSVKCYQSVIKGKESKGALRKRYGKVLERTTAKFETRTEEANVTKVEFEKIMELEAISTECEDLEKSQSNVKCVEVELVVQIENFGKQLHDCEK